MSIILSNLKRALAPIFTVATVKALTLLITLSVSATTLNAQNVITNGIGEYIEFNKQSMLLKLELGVPTSDPLEAIALDTSKRLSFRLLEDKTARRWVQVWIQNLSINSPPDVLKAQTDDLIRMTQAIPEDLKQGDLVEFDRLASDSTVIMLNGVELDEFKTPEFFEFLLSAFIGPIPPSTELKTSLLQSGNIDSATDTLFSSLSYSLERSDYVAGWVGISEDEAEEVVEEEPAEEEEVVAEVAEEIEEPAEPEAVVETVVAVAPEPEPKPEPKPAPPPIRITAESLLAVQNYQREMLVKIYQNIEYPRAAQRRNREGSLRVAVAVNQDGSLNGVEILQEAEYEGFNKAVFAAVDDASPFKSLPETVLDLPMVVEIPIQFKLQ